jgi:hypothetical protein
MFEARVYIELKERIFVKDKRGKIYKEQVLIMLSLYPNIYLEGKEIHQKPRSVQPAFEPEVELETSRVRIRYTTTLGYNALLTKGMPIGLLPVSGRGGP